MMDILQLLSALLDAVLCVLIPSVFMSMAIDEYITRKH